MDNQSTNGQQMTLKACEL